MQELYSFCVTLVSGQVLRTVRIKQQKKFLWIIFLGYHLESVHSIDHTSFEGPSKGETAGKITIMIFIKAEPDNNQGDEEEFDLDTIL